MDQTAVVASNRPDPEEQLKAIRLLIEQSDQHLLGHRQKLYAALQATFRLTFELEQASALKDFVLGHGGTWGKVAVENPFQPVVRIAFSGSAGPSKSQYASILKFARNAGIKLDDLSSWLERSGIDELYRLAVSSEKVGYEDLYEETRPERLQQAKALLEKETLGSKIALHTMGPEMPVPEYKRAIVRSYGTSVEVVRILESKPEEIEQDLLSVVPATGPFARPKLGSKKFYELFRCADLHSRLVETSVGGHTEPSEGGSAEKNTATAKLKLLFEKRAGLLLEADNGVWRGRSVGTQTTFAGVSASFSKPLDGLDQAKSYFLSSRQCRLLAQNFLPFSDWSIRLTATGAVMHSPSPGSEEITFEHFDLAAKAWRALAEPLSIMGTLHITSAGLVALSSWQGEHKAAAQFGHRVPYPRLFALGQVDGRIVLKFPNDGTRYRVLGELILPQGVSEIGDFEGRYFARGLTACLSAISRDYGMGFTGNFCWFTEGLSALCLRSTTEIGDLELTLPLCVALAGDLAEITTPMKS